ncbi:hypothetical protein BCR44DRAFT_1448458, partial [Catenaria anguillulae PL171]
MVRRAISAAVRAEQLHVLDWWVNAISKLFLTHELSMCWEAAYEAAESVQVLEHIKKLRMADHDGNEAIMRAHGASNLAVMQWWFSQVPRLDKVRFLLPHMLTWHRLHVIGNLDYLWLNDIGQRTGPCLRLCWRTNAPDLLKCALDKTDCSRCLDIIQSPSPSTCCPVPECAHDHCIECTIPRDGLFRDRRFHRQNLVMVMCKHGIVEGFRACLLSRPDAVANVHRQALLVASKCGHLGILKVWLEECQDVDFRAYPLWDGVGISVLDWLLEHDVDGKWLRWMSLDEVSRAGQTHVLDWWLIKFREGRVPVLRFSYRALQFN